MDEDTSRGFGRIEALIETSAKNTNSRLDAIESQFAHMRNSVKQLEGRQSEIEIAVRKARDEAHKSSHDLSEHIKKDEDTASAIARHMKKMDDGQAKLAKELADATKGQNLELGRQTKSLTRIERLGPVIIAIATAVSAYFSSRAGQPPPIAPQTQQHER